MRNITTPGMPPFTAMCVTENGLVLTMSLLVHTCNSPSSLFRFRFPNGTFFFIFSDFVSTAHKLGNHIRQQVLFSYEDCSAFLLRRLLKVFVLFYFLPSNSPIRDDEHRLTKFSSLRHVSRHHYLASADFWRRRRRKAAAAVSG